MKSLVCLEPNSLEIKALPRVEPPAGWVPIDVLRVGICGTDYHTYQGHQAFINYPLIMGHEVSGVVSQDYAGEAFQPGELVLANPYLSCGTCHACSCGKPNCCENIQVIGVHRDGAMAEQIALPEQNLIRAEGLTPDQAAMVEFLAIGRHAVARTQIIPSAKSLVIGAGPIGLASALFAKIEGAEVTIADVSPEKLAIARKLFGFDTMQVGVPDRTEITMSFTHVFDATGNITAMNNGLYYVAHGGTYTLVSVVKEDLNFPDPEFHKRETTLIGSRNALNADFRAVINAIREGKIDTEKLNTHSTTLAGAIDDLPRWSRDRDQVVKAIIEVQ